MFDIMISAVLDDPSREDEFEKFVKEYEKIMFSVAMGVLNNHHDAEDALIDAMVGIAKNFSRISELDAVTKKAYACRCARNRAINIFNARSRRYESETPVDEISDDAVYEAQLCYVCEDIDTGTLGDIIMKLGDTYRDVLFMYYAESMTTKEIASALGLKVKTVQARLTRGKRSLIKLIDEVKKNEKR